MEITGFCTGCRACEQLCPKQCISMKPNGEGFLVAEIDETSCIHCNLCRKRCPQNNTPLKHGPKRVVAVRYKQEAELKNSASGGAFVAMAHRVLEQGGFVFGAVYMEHWTVGHVAVAREEDLCKLQGSKYVQSNTLHTYTEAKRLLDEGKTVLFSGTPCQIGGLRTFLRKDYENLLTLDLICHGVPSPLLFRKYIQWLERKTNGKVLGYDFRDKSGGWGLGYRARIKTKTKTKTKTANLDPYYYHFLKGNTYRECCYECHYCTQGRVADMTIGDYWGIEKEHPAFYSTQGVSVVLLNTEKALKYFRQVESRFYIHESTFGQASKYNHNLLHPTRRPEIRNSVYRQLDGMGVKEYFDTVLKAPCHVYDWLKGLLPPKIKLALKNFKK